MGTSGNPAKAAEEAAKKTASASDFKRRKQGRPLPLPSGLVVKARRVELAAFLRTGNIPNPLMEIVNEALEKGRNADVSKMIQDEEGTVDLKMVNEMYTMVDNIVVASIVEPQVHELPAEGEDRDDDLLYTDDVDDEDKMFIYQWATGGTDDVAQFRREAAADLAPLAEGSSRPQPAKRASRAKK
jgi:hypothetical protein